MTRTPPRPIRWTMDHVDTQGGRALRYLIERGARIWPPWVGVYDWNRAFWDPGPSPAGNLGPYAHVPVAVTWENTGATEELVVRAYPRDKRTRERLVRMLGWRECEGTEAE